MRQLLDKVWRDKLKNNSVIAIIFLLFIQKGMAEENVQLKVATIQATSQQIPIAVEEKIRGFFQSTIELSLSPYNKDYIAINTGARSFLASKDGRYIYLGKVIDTDVKIDLNEQVTQESRAQQLIDLDESLQLSFPATGEELFAVTLFTDIDCGYCRRFHSHMSQYNNLGIRVNYLMLPRAGKHSVSYEKTLAVLCSINPKKNMTLAMQGKVPTFTQPIKQDCQNSLDQQMSIAEKFAITATPSMLLPNGKIIQGVVAPEQLLAQVTGAR